MAFALQSGSEGGGGGADRLTAEFILGMKLGQGSQGKVLRGYAQTTGACVALKFVNAESEHVARELELLRS